MQSQVLIAGGLVLFFVLMLIVLSAYIEGKRWREERREQKALQKAKEDAEMNNLIVGGAHTHGHPPAPPTQGGH
uniref:Col_cuticle_N domain-containing protein n=1 Tax=Steinernema glaseri TaxID=37863 RepID=A0A1I7ZTD5_9BILA